MYVLRGGGILVLIGDMVQSAVQNCVQSVAMSGGLVGTKVDGK